MPKIRKQRRTVNIGHEQKRMDTLTHIPTKGYMYVCTHAHKRTFVSYERYKMQKNFHSKFFLVHFADDYVIVVAVIVVGFVDVVVVAVIAAVEVEMMMTLDFRFCFCLYVDSIF